MKCWLNSIDGRLQPRQCYPEEGSCRPLHVANKAGRGKVVSRNQKSNGNLPKSNLEPRTLLPGRTRGLRCCIECPHGGSNQFGCQLRHTWISTSSLKLFIFDSRQFAWLNKAKKKMRWAGGFVTLIGISQ